MALDPSTMMGISPPQGISNTQIGMPEQAGPPPPSQMPAGGQPPAPQAPPKKPPSMMPPHVAKMLAEAINAVKMEAAKNMVEFMGDPRGATNTKPTDLLRAWRKRNPDIDPLFEKIVNKQSDDEILNMMYPLRRPLIRYGRRTYTEQVEFAEYMNILDMDPRYASLDGDDEDDAEDDYEPPQSDFPSVGEEPTVEEDDDDILEPEDEETEE